MNSIAVKLFDMERACFEQPWSLPTIVATLENPCAICVIEERGFALGLRLCGECELFRIAVLPQYRGQGAGLSLMRNFLRQCGDCPVFLEVASRNTPAIKLYQKCGFAEINRRKNYYPDDDGITMKKQQGRHIPPGKE